MNILLIAYYYPPIENAGSVRPQRMVKYLKKNGHKISVLTCSYSGSNSFGDGIIRIEDPGFNNERKGIKRLKWLLRRIRSEIFNLSGRYSSIFDGWKKNIISSAMYIRKKSDPDIIIVTYPPLETLEAGIYLSEKFSVPLITDLRDGLTLDPIDLKNFNKFRSIRSHYEKIEEKALEHSVGVMSFSEPYTKYLKSKYRKKEVYTVLNGYDPDDYKVQALEESLKNKKEINIIFTGRIGLSYKYNSIKPFINAIKKLRDNNKDLADNVMFHFAGEFTRKETKMINELEQDGLFNMYGKLSRKGSLAMQREADLLLIFSQNDRRSAIPLKYFEYLFWKKPIIALSKDNYLEELINRDRTGICVDPEDSEKIYLLLKDLLQHRGKYLQDLNLRSDISKFSFTYQFKVLDSLTSLK